MVGATRALRSQFRLGVLLVVEVHYSRMISARPYLSSVDPPLVSLGLHCRDYKGVNGPSRLCLKPIILIGVGEGVRLSTKNGRYIVLHILWIFIIGFELVVKTFFLYII
jgi:hypothetical protein